MAFKMKMKEYGKGKSPIQMKKPGKMEKMKPRGIADHSGQHNMKASDEVEDGRGTVEGVLRSATSSGVRRRPYTKFKKDDARGYKHYKKDGYYDAMESKKIKK